MLLCLLLLLKMFFTLPSSLGVNLIILLITLAFIFYKYTTRNFDYWKKRGVPYEKPIPLFGNFLPIFLFHTTIGHMLEKLYPKYHNVPYFGLFGLNQPYLIIKDPILIKSVMVKDFSHFPDHTLVSDEKCDSMAANFPFFSKNPQWKLMRTKMTPVFTAGKIKNMLPLINTVIEEMKIYLDKNKNIEIKEVCAKYATDAIATCAFGIDAHCFIYEDAQFRVIGKSMRNYQWYTTMRHTCYFFAPDLVRFFKMPFFNAAVINFMRETFWETLGERRKTKIKRNDVIDIINQIIDETKPEDEFKFEGDRVVAQAGQFYSAGFETISSAMAYTLYELCFHPSIQTKIRAELTSLLAQYGELSYEAVHDMKYLNMVISETLRKYPFVPFLDRMCVDDYKIPGTELVVEKGTPVYIPVLGLHHDPEYFPDPDKYDPERFSDENKDSFPSFAYLPFGEGPRNCIGKRFGLMVVKLGLAQILLNYEVMKSLDTPVPIEFNTKGLFLVSTNDLPMKFKKIAP